MQRKAVMMIEAGRYCISQVLDFEAILEQNRMGIRLIAKNQYNI